MQKLYENIKKLRIDKGWSQTELAIMVGYADKSMISKIEKGLVDLSSSQVRKFAEVFGVSTSELEGEQQTGLKPYPNAGQLYTVPKDAEHVYLTMKDLKDGDCAKVVKTNGKWSIQVMPKRRKVPIPKRMVVKGGRLYIQRMKPRLIPIVVEDTPAPVGSLEIINKINKPKAKTRKPKDPKLVPSS